MRNFSFLAIASFLALGACGGDEATPANDAGTTIDLGSGDSGPRDMGSNVDANVDPCAAGSDNSTDTVGCNGDILGAEIADNTFGGRCTIPDPEDARGTCVDEDAFCFVNEDGMPGYCAKECARPSGTPYVSTGGCPEGSRCFELDTTEPIGQCFTDCEVDDDCVGFEEGYYCDVDGACEPPFTEESDDAGVPDLDGGVPDATTSDLDADTTELDGGAAS